MAPVTTPSVVRQIESLFDGGSVAGLSDRQLLERFIARRDAAGEAAFAALVARHGPDGPGRLPAAPGRPPSCRGRLPGRLPRPGSQGPSIRDPDLLGNWLYGVALRTASKARARLARRQKNEEGSAMRHRQVQASRSNRWSSRPSSRSGSRAGRGPASRDRPPARALSPAGRALLLRGPHARRSGASAPLPGRHGPQPVGPGGDKLRRGLTRRGVALVGAAAWPRRSASRSASASVSSLLCDTTTRAAIDFAAGQAAARSASATALAQEVLRSMLIHKLKLHRSSLLLLGPRHRRGLSTIRAPAIEDEPRKAAASSHRRRPTSRAQGRRPRAGCSSSAACSIRRASRCRTRR